MGAKIKIKKSDFSQLESSYKALDGKKVQVGVLGEQAWLAGIHEYGCNITVTEKMRKWLAANGLHLKKSTTEIHIPERSFLRSGYDSHRDEVIKQLERLFPMLGQGMTAEDICGALGLLLSGKIKDFAVELDTPEKHPFTLERNDGKTNPLVDSGDMIGAISYRVE